MDSLYNAAVNAIFDSSLGGKAAVNSAALVSQDIKQLY